VNAREIEILQRASAGIEQQLAAIHINEGGDAGPLRRELGIPGSDKNHAQSVGMGGTRIAGSTLRLERVKGIEPSSSAWKTECLSSIPVA
jgi:hypothetical protein